MGAAAKAPLSMVSIPYYEVSMKDGELDEEGVFDFAVSVLEKEAKGFGDAEIDLDKAKTILRNLYTADNTDLTTIAGTVSESALAETSNEVEMQLSSCETAMLWLAFEVTSLFAALLGLPSSISKRVGKAIVKRAQKQLTKAVAEIARKYFQDASDLLSVATGIVEFIGVLGSILSPDKIIATIIGEMTWWEVPLYSALIAANIALLFVASAPAIVVKLALLTPAVVDVVKATIETINACD